MVVRHSERLRLNACMWQGVWRRTSRTEKADPGTLSDDSINSRMHSKTSRKMLRSLEDCLQLLQTRQPELLEKVVTVASDVQTVSLIVAQRLGRLSSRVFVYSEPNRAAHDAMFSLAQDRKITSSKQLEDHCRLVLSTLCAGKASCQQCTTMPVL